MPYLSNEQLIDGLKRLYRRIGHTPSAEDINADPALPAASTYYRHFGTLAEAMRLAGLDPRHSGAQPIWTDEELIMSLKNLAEQLGHRPSISEIDAAPGMPTSKTYRRRFGALPWA